MQWTLQYWSVGGSRPPIKEEATKCKSKLWLYFSNIDGANVLNSFLFWVLKAINDHLDTLDSTGQYIYTYYDIQKPKTGENKL